MCGFIISMMVFMWGGTYTESMGDTLCKRFVMKFIGFETTSIKITITQLQYPHKRTIKAKMFHRFEIAWFWIWLDYEDYMKLNSCQLLSSSRARPTHYDQECVWKPYNISHFNQLDIHSYQREHIRFSFPFSIWGSFSFLSFQISLSAVDGCHRSLSISI